MSNQIRQSPAQIYFNKTYVTAAEIMKELNISRSALLHARRRGMLPDAIVLNDGRIFIWERVTIQANLDAWKIMLNIRKGR